MKKLLALALVLALVLGLVGCGKKQAEEIQPTDGTAPTNIVVNESQDVEPMQPTETIEVETEPQELNPYEEYISSVSKGQYRYEDLDGDGEQELFISRNNSESEIVTIVDGKPMRVMKRNHLFLCEGGIIGRYGEGAGGRTVMYYRMDNHEAVIVDIIKTQNDGIWYRGAVESEMNRITEEEAQNVSEQYVLLYSTPWYLTWLYSEVESE